MADIKRIEFKFKGVADIKRIEFKLAQSLMKVSSSVTQQTFTCSKSTKETKKGMKYVQS